MHDELLTIGRFARLCRLSVKQLRHYAELELLAPARVDPATGYRYYAPGQARDALTIALLRDMDLPLAVIARALAADPASRARILRDERDRLAERVRRDRARLLLLERLAEGGLPGYEVELTTEPARRFAVVREQCAPAEIGAAFGTGAGRLLPALGRAGADWEPPLWGLYPLDLTERIEITVAAPVPPGPDREIHGVAWQEVPGGPVAETVHSGPYTQLPLAYHALLAAVHERGLRPLGQVRETYLAGPAEAPEEELLTRLVIPVAEGTP